MIFNQNLNNSINANLIFKDKILIFVPHMDDEILGCGGTIAQLNNKNSVKFVFATDCRKLPFIIESLNINLNKIRSNESISALKTLGIDEKNIIFLNLPNHQLKKYSDTLTNELIKLIKKEEPDFIFTPFRYDRHPDHIELHSSTIRAYSITNSSAQLFEYFVYTDWQMLKYRDIRKYLNPELLIKINTSNVIDIKRKALDCFKSQTTIYFKEQYRPILNEAFLENNCRTHEFFLKTDLKSSKPVFKNSRCWIYIVYHIEPFLKFEKDRILSIAHKTKKKNQRTNYK